MSDNSITENKDTSLIKTIAILGGTGKEGSALGMRWALNGYRVIIGSRDAERATTTANEMNAELGGDYLIGTDNATAAAQSQIIILSVPYSAHKPTIESVREHLAGKILIDLTVPLVPPKVTTVHIPEGQSACLEAQAYLGESTHVVAAFQNVSASKLKNPNNYVDCDVLVCADDDHAKEEALALVSAAGLRGIDAGPLANAVAVEALTAVLLYISKKYKAVGAGIRITGIR